MKLLLILSAILASTSSFAFTPQVKITSFTYSDNTKTHVAEICGTVSEMTESPTFIKIVVDESSKQPANYNTLAGADGKFCLTVTTYAGTAIARIF